MISLASRVLLVSPFNFALLTLVNVVIRVSRELHTRMSGVRHTISLVSFCIRLYVIYCYVI